MSDAIKHECGIALVRLRKPLQHYIDSYGSPQYAVSKMNLLMMKQVNRGQDGAGVANIKLEVPPGHRYISRYRSIESQPLNDIFSKIYEKFETVKEENLENYSNAKWLQENLGFTGEIWLGHLRYGTHGANSIENCHPMLRQSNWRSRNLVCAGNFNMTNAQELFEKLVRLGQHPKEMSDTVTVMEKIGHFLDEENQRVFDRFKGIYDNPSLSDIIEDNLDMQRVLHRACRDFDGGYAMCGITGNGTTFVIRDPAGIRPAYYFVDDEHVVVASEKPAIKNAFNVDYSKIIELKPGNALIIDKYGEANEFNIIPPAPKKMSCSFERIYFSRASDPDIYHERKELGKLLVPQILKEINYDLENTVFSFIPNTAETAFYGLMEGLDDYLTTVKKDKIQSENLSDEALTTLLNTRPRIEKIVAKDVKQRTFITDDSQRNEMVSQVYELTFGIIRKNIDTLVIVDDSIVRGTTLERSVLTMLDKLEPKKIVIVSSAPQIRYPDCYGIDMSKIREFVAFRAALALINERGYSDLLDIVKDKCLKASDSIKEIEKENFVKEVYAPFTYDEISNKIAEIVTPKGIKSKVSVIFQTIENLHKACPNHAGDWYFSGNYPTPGGNRVVNRAYLNFSQGKLVRSY